MKYNNLNNNNDNSTLEELDIENEIINDNSSLSEHHHHQYEYHKNENDNEIDDENNGFIENSSTTPNFIINNNSSYNNNIDDDDDDDNNNNIEGQYDDIDIDDNKDDGKLIELKLSDNPAVRTFQRIRNSKKSVLVSISVALFVDMICYGIILPIIPLVLKNDYHVSESVTGLLFAMFSAGSILSTPFFGYLTDRIGRKIPFLMGMASLAISTLLFAYGKHLAILFIARFAQGVSSAITWVVGLALIADLYPPAMLGTTIGTIVGGNGVGALVGPILGGVLFEHFGYHIPFLVAAGFALADLFIRIVFVNDKAIEYHKQIKDRDLKLAISTPLKDQDAKEIEKVEVEAITTTTGEIIHGGDGSTLTDFKNQSMNIYVGVIFDFLRKFDVCRYNTAVSGVVASGRLYLRSLLGLSEDSVARTGSDGGDVPTDRYCPSSLDALRGGATHWFVTYHSQHTAARYPHGNDRPEIEWLSQRQDLLAFQHLLLSRSFRWPDIRFDHRRLLFILLKNQQQQQQQQKEEEESTKIINNNDDNNYYDNDENGMPFTELTIATPTITTSTASLSSSVVSNDHTINCD
ncbi:hypothetical protein PPL_00848 [Heterostelium album PN500]|uniref:Major facilitator superfamily (MFS) profile domain-containing protein n=1 Tax=Heterostelium pallidum (strain ATCC 26659 / Pp 5 / PN500) TaxID=670386 RepID=D3AYS9_HETP5|nr:hypothetical protein PPL_00848 [Heterostelium album PN500]EFA85619.1 hypothetical protein PPL_00848 [Heterostelium album PN500]|eukprot:XP_020437726.1 hypothetical protein PPL_00848 [Heterostelium album PN500]